MGRAFLSLHDRPGNSRAVRGGVTAAALCALALVAAASIAAAQTPRQKRGPASEQAAPAASVDKRDSVVTVAGPFAGRPYWLALAQCGGIYFKLSALYTDLAVHARVVKPDPTANAEFSRKLTEATRIATTFFDAAERFLMTDRGIERADAVLTYEGQMRAAGERFKTIEAGLPAAKPCPGLYQACREAHPKQCSEPLGSMR
jgi:hypothetical protein